MEVGLAELFGFPRASQIMLLLLLLAGCSPQSHTPFTFFDVFDFSLLTNLAVFCYVHARPRVNPSSYSRNSKVARQLSVY
jgi:hypothetical protein